MNQLQHKAMLVLTDLVSTEKSGERACCHYKHVSTYKEQDGQKLCEPDVGRL